MLIIFKKNKILFVRILASLALTCSFRLYALGSTHFCEQKEKYFDSLNKTHINPIEGLKNILSQNVNLFFIMDYHSSHETETLGEDLLSALKDIDPKVRPDCLLLEKDSDSEFEKAIQSYFDGNFSVLKDFKDSTQFMRWNGSMDNLERYYFQLKSLGIRLYSVDMKQLGNISMVDNLNERDQKMAYKIKNLYSTRKCTKSILSIGAMHVVKTNPGVNRVTLSHHIEQFGLVTKTIYLAISGQLSRFNNSSKTHFINEGSEIGPEAWASESFVAKVNSKSLLVCKSLNDFQKSSYTFSNDKNTNLPLLYLPKFDSAQDNENMKVPSNEGNDFYGNYKDVDLIWIHTCRNSSCRRNNISSAKFLKSKGFHFYD